ncbi:hypothetical protein E2C01_016125 [Portunus trituberculatus]|uniref:Uncharacterized protein n=1 Tax=Portunus trituberculatus TaxID=210409 RepID=A0A5B7DQ87_PORTR|nr:hypothetical protein [Portunus trituberculatus]
MESSNCLPVGLTGVTLIEHWDPGLMWWAVVWEWQAVVRVVVVGDTRMCTRASEVSSSTRSFYFLSFHTHIPSILPLLIPLRHPSNGVMIKQSNL